MHYHQVVELEELVRKANEGLATILKLRNEHGDKIEQLHSAYPEKWDNISDWSYTCKFKFRIKPKKEFESFITTNGWEIEIVNNLLKIGCKTMSFSLKEIKRTLQDLCNDNCIRSLCGNFHAKRTGIIQTGGGLNILPWTDADRILKQLEEMDK